MVMIMGAVIMQKKLESTLIQIIFRSATNVLVVINELRMQDAHCILPGLHQARPPYIFSYY
jgi:hypothetical protein